MTSQKKKSEEAENRDTDFNHDSLDDGTIKHQEELKKEKHISHYKHTLWHSQKLDFFSILCEETHFLFHCHNCSLFRERVKYTACD